MAFPPRPRQRCPTGLRLRPGRGVRQDRRFHARTLEAGLRRQRVDRGGPAARLGGGAALPERPGAVRPGLQAGRPRLPGHQHRVVPPGVRPPGRGSRPAAEPGVRRRVPRLGRGPERRVPGAQPERLRAVQLRHQRLRELRRPQRPPGARRRHGARGLVLRGRGHLPARVAGEDRAGARGPVGHVRDVGGAGRRGDPRGRDPGRERGRRGGRVPRAVRRHRPGGPRGGAGRDAAGAPGGVQRPGVRAAPERAACRAVVRRAAAALHPHHHDRGRRRRGGPLRHAVRHPHDPLRRGPGLLPQRRAGGAEGHVQPPGSRGRRLGAAGPAPGVSRRAAQGDGVQRVPHVAQPAHARAAGRLRPAGDAGPGRDADDVLERRGARASSAGCCGATATTPA